MYDEKRCRDHNIVRGCHLPPEDEGGEREREREKRREMIILIIKHIQKEVGHRICDHKFRQHHSHLLIITVEAIRVIKLYSTS